MKTIAIGGLRYSIRDFFNDSVQSEDVGVWGQKMLYRAIERDIKSHDGPVRIVGFSRGATFALDLYETCENVAEVYAHSVGDLPKSFRKKAPRKDGLLRLFRTTGDKAGGVYEQTRLAFQTYAECGNESVAMLTIPFSKIENPTTNIERAMNRFQHVFHNCLVWLPKEILR